jgi:hypothetical protein
VPIANFAKVVKNLPDSEQTLIEQNLYYTVKLNSTTAAENATIRDGSYTQTFGGQMVYTTTFLVDIPNLKQTYRVSDQWSPLPPDQSGLYDYTTLVLCPDPGDLIYEPFTCVDRVTQEAGQ